MTSIIPLPQTPGIHQALIYSRRTRSGYVYDVAHLGETVVRGSHNPSHQLARALLARGLMGRVWIYDGKTGKPRLTFIIEGAAGLTVTEDDVRGLRTTKYRPFVDAVRLRKRESDEGRLPVPDNDDDALLLDRSHAA